MTDYVLTGLVKRRAKLAGDIENTHEALRKMVIDLEALDATILQFNPEYVPEGIKAKTFSAADLALPPPAEDSKSIAARVACAREVQRKRFEKRGIRTNAEAEGEVLEEIARPDSAGFKLLTDAAEKMKLTARGYHRVLRVARTIADLSQAETVARPHIAEALSYRRAAFA